MAQTFLLINLSMSLYQLVIFLSSPPPPPEKVWATGLNMYLPKNLAFSFISMMLGLCLKILISPIIIVYENIILLDECEVLCFS